MSFVKIQVKTKSKEYPIFIGNNILNKLQKILKDNFINFNQCLVIIDKNIPKKLINKSLSSLPKKKYHFIILLLVKKIKIKKVLIRFYLSS